MPARRELELGGGGIGGQQKNRENIRIPVVLETETCMSMATCRFEHVLPRGNVMDTKTQHQTTPATPMTPADAARIQSAMAKANGGAVPKGSFAARAASAAAKLGKR